MRPLLSTLKWLDFIPIGASLLIILVCNVANIFVLKKPVYVMATLPILAITLYALYRIVNKRRPA